MGGYHMTILGFLLISAWLTAAGGTADGQEQKKDNRRAGEVYENLELYESRTVWRVDRNMMVFNVSLGVECAHCHVKDEWASEDAELKQVARREIRMMDSLRRDHFKGLKGPTCWTCHRGAAKPATNPEGELTPPKIPDPSPFLDSDEPAETAYKNIQFLKPTPARRLEDAMVFLATRLGVECSHCHVEGDWASDEREQKRTARRMLGMVRDVRRDHYGGKRAVSCWTCHRGSNEPELNPPM